MCVIDIKKGTKENPLNIYQINSKDFDFLFHTCQGNGQTVLLVSQEDSLLEALSDYLLALNYRIVQYNTIRDTLTHMLYLRTNVDFGIIDQALLDGSGVSLMRTLKEKNVTFPYFMMVGHIDSLRISRYVYFDDNCLAIFEKPFSVIDIIVCLCKALNPTAWDRIVETFEIRENC